MTRRWAAFATLVIVSAHSLAGAPSDVAVVVRGDTPVDNLSFEEARKLFMGDRQFWSSNLRVNLLIRAPAARERDVVLRTIYGMSEAQFRQYWISKIFRLEASTGPKIVYSAGMATELISAIPGAVAFSIRPRAQRPQGSQDRRAITRRKGYRLH
jgi:hypothetical protein